MTGANAGCVASIPVSSTTRSQGPPVYPFVHHVSAWIAYALTSITAGTIRSSEIRPTHGFAARAGIASSGTMAKTAGSTGVEPPKVPPTPSTATRASVTSGASSELARA